LKTKFFLVLNKERKMLLILPLLLILFMLGLLKIVTKIFKEDLNTKDLLIVSSIFCISEVIVIFIPFPTNIILSVFILAILLNKFCKIEFSKTIYMAVIVLLLLVLTIIPICVMLLLLEFLHIGLDFLPKVVKYLRV
jgi:hypothetical protein